MRVGLISDTHGFFEPALTTLFAGCERIVHAGDVVGRDVLLLLSTLAPVTAVRGNNDVGEDAEGLPEEARLRLEGLEVLVLHQLGKPERPLAQARTLIGQTRTDLVVYGHSHVPAAQALDGRLYVNPGSAGKRRFKLPRTAAILTVKGRRARVEVHDLESPALVLLREPFEVEL